MGSLGIIEDEILRECVMKKLFIMDKIQVVIDELLLDRSVITFNVGVNLRAVRIGKEVRNTLSH